MNKRASRIYCGDGSNLPRDYNRFGSRYECMQCGFGAAMTKYKWQPASGHKKLPERKKKGCLRPAQHKKGSVQGNQFNKLRGMSPEQGDVRVQKGKYIVIWTVISIALFAILYFTKPDFITKTDDNKVKHIVWEKFAALYIPVVILLAVIMIFIIHRL